MINNLNTILHELLQRQVEAFQPPPFAVGQIRFHAPNQDLITHLGTLNRIVLNVYLVDLRENQTLRSNERTRWVENGVWQEEPAPRRVDCHYLITAWSPATDAEYRVRVENELLYDTLHTLMAYSPLNPSRVYAPGNPPVSIDEAIRAVDLPTRVVPAEGFPKLPEFWGTMGTNRSWKPALYYVVTLPVLKQKRIAGPMVTTRITEYRVDGDPDTREIWIQIGGHVLDTTTLLPDGSPMPVAGAQVALETPTGDRLDVVVTDKQGRFTFGGLRQDNYRLQAWATGHPPLTRPIPVPSPTGEYDLRFT